MFATLRRGSESSRRRPRPTLLAQWCREYGQQCLCRQVRLTGTRPIFQNRKTYHLQSARARRQMPPCSSKRTNMWPNPGMLLEVVEVLDVRQRPTLRCLQCLSHLLGENLQSNLDLFISSQKKNRHESQTISKQTCRKQIHISILYLP